MPLRRQHELHNVATLAAELAGCDAAVVSTAETDILTVQVAVGVNRPDGSVMPLGDSYCDLVRRNAQPLIVADTALDPQFQANPRLCFFDRTLRFYAGVPVLDAAGGVAAVLAVLDHTARPAYANQQSPDAVALIKRLEKLAVLAATILEIAAERDTSRIALAEAALLRDINGVLVSELSLPATLDTILRQVMDLTAASYAQVWEVRDDAWMAHQLAFAINDPADKAAFSPLRSKTALPIEELAIAELLRSSGQIIFSDLESAMPNRTRVAVAVEQGIKCLIVSALLAAPRRFVMVLGMRQMPQSLTEQAAQIERISQALQPVLSSKLANEQIQLLGSALAATQDGVLLFKTSWPPGTLRITYTNRAFTELTQHAPNEIIGASPFVLPGLDANPQEVAKLQRSVETSQPSVSVLQIRRRDGSHFWAEVTLVPLPGVDGLGEYFVAVLLKLLKKRPLYGKHLKTNGLD